MTWPQPFTASRAGMHAACPASANLPAAIPNWKDPDPIVGGAADQGTDAHVVFEQLMQYPNADIRAWIKVLTYVEELRATRRFKVLTEQKLTANWLQQPRPTTVDLALHTLDELHVLDLKWGKIPVPVTDNTQMIFYGLTMAEMGLAPKAKGLWIHVLQPRANNMEAQFLSATELAQHKADLLAAEAKVLAGDLTFGPSDYCTFCPAFPHGRGAKGAPLCPATMKLLYPQPYDEDEILNL